jgi:hypothetical protein
VMRRRRVPGTGKGVPGLRLDASPAAELETHGAPGWERRVGVDSGSACRDAALPPSPQPKKPARRLTVILNSAKKKIPFPLLSLP